MSETIRVSPGRSLHRPPAMLFGVEHAGPANRLGFRLVPGDLDEVGEVTHGDLRAVHKERLDLYLVYRRLGAGAVKCAHAKRPGRNPHHAWRDRNRSVRWSAGCRTG